MIFEAIDKGKRRVQGLVFPLFPLAVVRKVKKAQAHAVRFWVVGSNAMPLVDPHPDWLARESVTRIEGQTLARGLGKQCVNTGPLRLARKWGDCTSTSSLRWSEPPDEQSRQCVRYRWRGYSTAQQDSERALSKCPKGQIDAALSGSWARLAEGSEKRSLAAAAFCVPASSALDNGESRHLLDWALQLHSFSQLVKLVAAFGFRSKGCISAEALDGRSLVSRQKDRGVTAGIGSSRFRGLEEEKQRTTTAP